MTRHESMSARRFVFCSEIGLAPPLLRVAEIITRNHGLEGHVIAPDEFSVASVHSRSGRFSHEEFDPSSTFLDVHFLPPRQGNVERWGFARRPFQALLRSLHPDFVWLHSEFWQGIAHQFLWHYRLRARPVIVAYVAINHAGSARPLVSFQKPFFNRTRLKQLYLWPRLHGVAARANITVRCARRIGLPAGVPAVANYLPVFGPDDAAPVGASLPWCRGNGTIVGFAGELTEQKGWKVLLAAAEQLPENFKFVLVGDGTQREQLHEYLEQPSLRHRVHHIPSIPRATLLATYPMFDVFVLPSITMPSSVEQFGMVLAEAMACGVPVIGSESGAIPETIGRAGLVVPEGDPRRLAQAIKTLSEDSALRRQVIVAGEERFRTHFSCEAYAKAMAELLTLDRNC